MNKNILSRFFAICLLLACLSFSLFSCGEKKSTEGGAPSSDNVPSSSTTEEEWTPRY